MSDYEYNQEVTNEDLQEISTIGQKFVTLNTRVQDLEKLLEETKKHFDYVQKIELPEAMDKIGLSDFRLNTGQKIEVHPLMIISYPKENLPEIDTWLDNNDHGGIVKRSVNITIPKGTPKEQIKPLLDFANRFGFYYEDKLSIHYQTLQKWGREMKAEGEMIPDNLFNVYEGRQAKITT